MSTTSAEILGSHGIGPGICFNNQKLLSCIHMKRIVLLIGLCFFSLTTLAQQIRFQHYTAAEGFSSRGSLMVTQDSSGFLWIATNNDLLRFDGVQTTEWNTVTSPVQRKVNNKVVAVTVDFRDNVWAACNQGVFCVQRNRKVVTMVESFIDRTGERVSAHPNGIAVDFQGRVWVTTDMGLYSGTEKDNLYKEVVFSDQEEFFMRKIIQTGPDGTVYFTVGNRIFHKRPADNTFRVLTTIEDTDLTDISTLYIENDNCWLGHFDKSKLYCYNLKSKSLTSYQLDEDSKEGVSSPVLAICRMNDSLIWAGSYVDKGTIQNAGGVSIINTRTKSVQRIFSDRLNRSSCLSNAYIEYLFRDKQGSMWVVGTDGIDFYHPTMSAFTIYKPDFVPGEYSIPPSGIVDIDADQDGNVWIASKSDGLVKISKEGKVVQSVSLMDGRFRQDGFVFGMIACGKNEVLYIAGTNEILSVDTKVKGGFTANFKVRKSGVSGVTRMVVDNQNNLWVATHHDGVYKLGVDGTEEHFGTEEDEMHLIPTNEVLGLAVYGDTILACLGYEGLYLFQSGMKPDPVYSAKTLAAKGWTKCKLRDVRMNSNWIFFSTKDQGVRYLNRKTNALSQLNEDNGLFQNGIAGIEIDKHGIIWIADVEGLTRFDANTNSIESFSAKRSLPETGFYNGAHAVNTLGIIYFSNHTHLISIDPDRNTVRDIGLNLTITSFKVNDKEYGLNGQNIVHQLEYDENNITITFTSLNFINPLDDEYFYKLEGFTNEWKPVPANRFLSFTNLPQGNYKLLLRVKNLNSSISNAEISFHVATAYYKTWWFISLIIILISALLYWAYRYRLSQILKLQSLRTEISNDLHDDIGSTLSSVYYSAELLKLQGEQQPELRNKIIDNISTNTRELVDRMRDIVWSIHVDQNETESLAIRIREYINRFDLPEGKQLVFNGNINQLKGVELNMRVRKNVFLVFKEALNNAIKHSEATIISVDLSITSQGLELQIIDNGKGISSNLTIEGNGLRTMKERMAEVGGKLTIQSGDEKGTKIHLVVPVGR